MSHSTPLNQAPTQPLLTFPDAEKSPLSIRAKALVLARARFAPNQHRQIQWRQLLHFFAQTTRARIDEDLSEGRLDLPSLREQPGNILPLAEYFLGIYSQRLDFDMPLISEAAQQVLEAHYWPGNTRELENVIHFALLVSSGAEILPEHLNLPGKR